MNNINAKSISAFLLLLGCSFFGSCTNDMESDGLANGKDGLIPVNIVMKGYQDYEETTNTRSASEELQNIQVVRQDIDIPGYELVTTIESSSMREAQTRANMNINSRFRMVIYDANGVQKGDCQYQVNGTSTTLVDGEAPFLTQGTYKFVCYTNNAATVSVANSINVANGDDFATCCVTKTVSATDNIVSIAFVRQMAQIQITAAATGFTNNTITFTSADVTSMPNLGVWNVNYGSTDAIGVTVSGASTISCANNIPYNILPVANTSTDITLKGITVEGKNKGDKTTKVTTIFEKGKSYRVTMNFQKKTSIALAGVNWATGNLILVNGVYKFHENQEDYSNAWNGGDYFNFNYLDPLNYSVSVTGSVWNKANDPCAKVAPAGTWRTPTSTELTNLIAQPSEWAKLNGVNGRYFGANKELFLPAAGYRYKTTKLTNSGADGIYWSSTPVGSSGSANFIGIQAGTVHLDARGHRAMGCSVRCVK